MRYRPSSLRRPWGALAAVLLAASLAAAQAPPSALTLEAAMQAAAAKNPRLSAARSRQAAADERVSQARAGLWPRLDVSEGVNRTTNPMWAFGTKLNQESIRAEDFDPQRLNDPDPITNYAGMLSLRWSLYDRGQTWASLDQARFGARAAEAAWQRTRQQVLAETVQAYCGLQLACARRDLAETSLATARQHLRLAESHLRHGQAVKSDVLRTQVRVAEIEQQRLVAESRASTAAAGLNAVMGQPVDAGLQPGTPLGRGASLDGALEDWEARALVQRPELQQLSLALQAAQAEVGKTRAAHRPSLDLLGSYEVNTEDFGDTASNYTLGAMVQLNLFAGGGLAARTREAQALLAELQALEQDLRQQVRVQTREAFFEARAADQRITAAAAAVDQAQEALRIVGSRYGSGLVTVVDLLDAELALHQARTRHLQAVYDLKAAAASLLLAAGSMGDAFPY
jgi:TolC family type I secretion outer membrane protein